MRKTVTAVLVSLLIVLSVLLCAVAFNSDKVTEELINNFINSFNSSNPSFLISYDTMTPTMNSGMKLDGLCVGNGKESFLTVSQVSVSAGISDIFRMMTGSQPKEIHVSVRGASVFANSAFIDSLSNLLNAEQNKKDKKSSFSLPFSVEIEVSNLWADVDLPGFSCSVGNINLFSRLGKGGLLIANATVPFVSASTSAGNITVEDFRISTDSSLVARLSIQKAMLNEDITAKRVSAIADFKDKLKVSAQLPETEVLGNKIENIALSAEYENGKLLSDITMDYVKADFTLLSEKGINIPLNDASFEKLSLSATLNSEEGFKAGGTAVLNADSEIPAIGKFKAASEIYADIKDFSQLESSSVFCLKIFEAECNVLDGKNKIEAYLYNLNDIRLSGSLMPGISLETTLEIAERSGIARLKLDSVTEKTIQKPLQNVVPSLQSAFTEQTEINGDINIEFELTETWFNSVFDAEVDISQILFLSGLRDANAVIKGSLSDGLIVFDRFNVRADSFYAVYNGKADLNWLGFDGDFVLVDERDSSKLVQALFVPAGDKTYNLTLTSDKIENTVLRTSFHYKDKRKFDVSNVIETAKASYPVDIEVEAISDLAVTLTDSSNEMKLLLGRDRILNFNSLFNGFELTLSNNEKIRISGIGSGSFNLETIGFNFVFENLGIVYSNLIWGTCDLELSETTLDMTDINFGFMATEYPIMGSLYLKFSNIRDFASIDFKGLRTLERSAIESLNNVSLEAKADLWTSNGDWGKVAYRDRNIVADVQSTIAGVPLKVDAIGSLKDNLYADVSLADVSFEVKYSQDKARIYKAKGKIGTFDISGLEALVDTRLLSMEGSVKLEHTMKNYSGDVLNKANVKFNAKLEKLGDILEGNVLSESEFSVGLEISDAQLSDTLPFADTDISVRYANGLLDVKGKLINGKYRFSDGYTELSIDPEFLFGFDAKGYVSEDVDLKLEDIFFPIELVNPVMNLPLIEFLDGDFTGSLLVYGPLKDITMYGMLYCNSFDMSVFYLPDQILSVKNITIVADEHVLRIANCPFSGYSTRDYSFFGGNLNLEAVIQNTGFESFEVNVKTETQPFDFILPLTLGSINLNLEGEVFDGEVKIALDSKAKLSISGEAVAQDFFGSFRFPDTIPQWYFDLDETINLDFTVHTGRNVEFCYPEINNSLVSLTCSENEKVRLLIDDYGKFSSEGDFELKAGRVYYFNNDFYITEGHMRFEDNPFFGDGFQIYIDASAQTRQYDSKGNPLDITLSMNNATFDNLNMRFSSNSGLSENEIIRILGQAFLPSDELSLASVASMAYTATEAVRKLDIVESNESFSLSAVIREGLNLDFLSARTPLIANILVDALPGMESDASLIAKYLNGTSVFAGKYFWDNIFAKAALLLETDSGKGTRNRFIVKDLALNLEFSVEWDTPFAKWTVFMHPQELSAFGFLDTIGFTVSKTIRY